MAAKKRKTAARKKKWARPKRKLFLLLLALILLIPVYGYVCAHIVHVRYTDAYIEDLSPFLDGAKILFITDLKLTDESDARRAVKLIRQLSQTNPDLIILGGDYTGMKFSDAFSFQSESGRQAIDERLRRARRVFFTELSAVKPSGGIIAVAGDKDSELAGLYEDCAAGNVRLLENAVEYVTLRGSPVAIVCYADVLTGNSLNFKFKGPSASDAVIVVSHNPDAYPLASSVTDAYGNSIADLMLSGHTLGGQIALFGKNIPGGYSGIYQSGVYNETGPNLIVSNGIGTDWLPMRLFAQAEAHVITLRRK